ncbi:hypothetical protein BI347_01095 [Chromobacterium sphagni]|uniref:DUF3304 domain-containing protein n=1 Tax=Chromobacterium sphagni TaxID=1903179 RepID=A0A1S1WY75_9NEIS|nr:hypothetical protein [Chromobacterium sphagni]OHX12251.1 hypothetical protein BI347_01095 [Chromobacterium sphagni]
MSALLRRTLVASLSLILIACATPPSQISQTAGGCVGQVMQAPTGMGPVQHDTLLANAIGAPGNGGLCEGVVYQQNAAAPGTIVYRVWDSGKPNSRLGRWWSFSKPQGPLAKYQADNAICPAWSRLNSMVRCQLKAGVQVAVGTGQSANCAPDPDFPPSPVNQVYVPNTSPDDIQVENCQDEGAFPPAM